MSFKGKTKAKAEDERPVRVVLVYPLAPSVEQAAALLFRLGEEFKISIVRIDDINFDALSDGTPTLFVMSSIDGGTRAKVKKALETQRRGEDSRVILVSEEKEGAAVQSWRQMGVHEFIMAPVVAQAIRQKLSRHRKKLLEALPQAAGEAPPPDPAPAPPSTATAASSPSPPRAVVSRDSFESNREAVAREFAVHGIVLGPNTFLFPEDSKEEPRQVVIKVAMEDLDPKEGQWVRRSELAVDPDTGISAGGDATWDWVYSMGDSQQEGGGFRFFGEQPVYDAASKTWAFKGKAPLMFREGAAGCASEPDPDRDHDPDQAAAGAEGPAPQQVFGYYSKCGLVMYKNAPGTGEAKVWFVRYFHGDPAAGKPTMAEPGGVNESSDEALLTALDQALRKGKKG